MVRHASRVLSLLVLLMPLTLVTAFPANAATPEKIQFVDGQDVLVVEDFDLNGKLLTKKTYPASTQSTEINFPTPTSDIQASGGPGGTSTTSGCRRVTVRNETESPTGATVFNFNIWTYWCNNGYTHKVYSISTGWYLSNVDWAVTWQGLVSTSRHYYQFRSGWPYSGYYHGRMGHFTQSWPWFTNNSYPVAKLWSHSNGTWTWGTSG